jgi:hypothetical protein
MQHKDFNMNTNIVLYNGFIQKRRCDIKIYHDNHLYQTPKEVNWKNIMECRTKSYRSLRTFNNPCTTTHHISNSASWINYISMLIGHYKSHQNSTNFHMSSTMDMYGLLSSRIWCHIFQLIQINILEEPAI